jgi:predicted nucleic acid-binding Zn ribbon protein
MELRCGACANAIPVDAITCPACGRTLGSAPARRRPPGLLLWAAVAAAVEVALTLVLMRSCG